MKEITRPESDIQLNEKGTDLNTPQQGPVISNVIAIQQKTPGQATIPSPKTEEKQTRNAGKAAAWDRSMLFL